MKDIRLPKANNRNFSAIDPLDGRYFNPEASRYLSETSRIIYQLYVESALAETLADFGIIPRSVAEEIEVASGNITVEDVYKEEAVTKHDIKALVNCIKVAVSDKAKPYVHFGATSYDIIATANSLQLKAAIENLVLPRSEALLRTLIDLTVEHAKTPQIGRTHGQHALPISFGFAMAEYVERLGTSLLALKELASNLHGKFSGAVGAHNGLSLFVNEPIKFEISLMKKIGLTPAPYSNQIVPPDNAIRLIDELNIMSGVMANLGNDMRHLQRTEINEVSEKFEKGQVGSSTMPHKKNPINFENVVSLSKQVTAQMVNANLNLSSDHQRDLTDSASSRFYVMAPALVAEMAERLNRSMSIIEVNQDAMKRNLELSKGGIAAEPLYLLFEKYGHVEAHELSKKLAHQAAAQNLSLMEVIESSPEALKLLRKFNSNERKIIESPEKYYLGLSSQKAKSSAAAWKKILAGV